MKSTVKKTVAKKPVAKHVTVTLVQKESKLVFSKEIATDTISEVSGTIAQNIIVLADRCRKYKINTGFSFSRKFDIMVSIDGEQMNHNKLYGTETIRFGVTLNPKNISNFAYFIHDLVEGVMTKSDELITDLSELLAEELSSELN